MDTRKLSLISAFFCVFVAAQFGWRTPAFAQTRPVRVTVIVQNAQTNEYLNAVQVNYSVPATACHPAAHATDRTLRTGEAEMEFTPCLPVPVTITVIGGADFDTQTKTVEIEPDGASQNVFFKLEGKGRTLHIRVRGRESNGSLVAVHFATVYDQQGKHVATTDYNGTATARTRDPMGETVTMRADGGSKWGEGTSSFIVGASEGGTTLTRSDDYVNFVLKGTGEETAEDVELAISVIGQGSSGRVPVHNATVYDGEGRHLVTTDYNGKATVHVKVRANGEPYTIRVDGGSRWKPASKEVFGGPRGSNGAVPYNLTGGRAVTVVLEPSTAAKELTVEVLDHDTDKPVGSATVTLYKPNKFPGTPVAHSETNLEGIATFSADEVAEAMLNGSAHVGAAAGGSKSTVQTLSGELLQGEAPKYVLYLQETQEKTKWSGTWYQGPYTIHVSGGNGAMRYTFLRQSDIGTCCPTTDQGSGGCSIKGNVATCTAQGVFQNSASQIWRAEHVTLTYEGDTIAVKSHIVASREKTDQYHPCPASGPEMSKCTSLYQGNTLTGTWTRQKP